MSALARYCLLAGAEVTGSDMREGAGAELVKEGAEVYRGARRDIIARAGFVVRSSAVPLSDPEISAALAMGKRVKERHEFLAEIASDFTTVAAVAGTHGKTTVTAMTAHILKCAGIPFVAHIGGKPVGMHGLEVLRERDGSLPRGIFLTEACEFGRHFLSLSPSVAAIVNVDLDHPDTYSDIDEAKFAFAKFVENCPMTLVRPEDEDICTNAHTVIRKLGGSDEPRLREKKNSRMPVCTYGFSSVLMCDGAQTVTLSRGDVEARFRLNAEGAHFACDAAFAVALAVELGAGFGASCEALSSFRGVERRAESVGRIEGAEAVFDYAHHPTELSLALSASDARGSTLAVFQPHTYSRTAEYMTGFAAALGRREELILMPVYAAREPASAGASAADLAGAIRDMFPQCRVHLAVSHDDAWNLVKKLAPSYDRVLFLGAGDIYDLKERVKDGG